MVRDVGSFNSKIYQSTGCKTYGDSQLEAEPVMAPEKTTGA
jgi:hypothetical protein